MITNILIIKQIDFQGLIFLSDCVKLLKIPKSQRTQENHKYCKPKSHTGAEIIQMSYSVQKLQQSKYFDNLKK